jgi:hypothetical protein
MELSDGVVCEAAFSSANFFFAAIAPSDRPSGCLDLLAGTLNID